MCCAAGSRGIYSCILISQVLVIFGIFLPGQILLILTLLNSLLVNKMTMKLNKGTERNLLQVILEGSAQGGLPGRLATLPD